jgi:HSP20 family protein
MKNNSISLFNDLFDDRFSLFQIKNDLCCLRTNIKELQDTYVFDINVAGIKKENINIEVNDGYLVINVSEEKENEDNQYLRREIIHKQCKRKYYIGNVKENQIKASLNDGILSVVVPKEVEEKKKNIEIS